MNSLLNDNRDDDIVDHHGDHHGRKDREITLGTTMVLGIFFALAVLCAVFFGFGYSVGAKRAVPAVAGEAGTNSTFSGFLKPAPGRSLTAPDKTAAAATAADVPYTPPPARAVTVKATEPSEDAVVSSAPATRPAGPAAVTAPPPPAIVPGGAFMVQIAAVSHQEDAETLVSSLKRRNYAVAIHSEPQDKLMHVQVGPFGDRKTADAMRLRLQGDGFNAIVKGN